MIVGSRSTKARAALVGGCLAVVVSIAGVAVATGHGSTAPGGDLSALAAASIGGATPASIGGKSGTGATAGSPDVIAAVGHIGALHHLSPPDIAIRLHHAASHRAVARLRRASGVHRTAVLDRGVIRLPHRRLRAAGVPMSDIRGFTPALTASSKPLWRSVARGELTVSFTREHSLRRRLGAFLPARRPHESPIPLRIGAFATVGLARIQAIVSSRAARTLGLAPRREVLVAAPKLSLDQLKADAHRVFGKHAKVIVTRPAPVDQSMASSYAETTIPASYLDLYRRAAVTCAGLPWTVLAGIGTVETGNGSNVHRSTAGAEGPMQFIPSTWAMYGYDADGDGKADINDPTDAVFSAARYLCAAGAGLGGQSLDNAIFSYNHAWWYVREVVEIANQLA